MKIIKPLKLGVLHKTYTFLHQHHLAITPICFFDLQSRQVLKEMPQWSLVQQSLGPTGLMDIAMPKPRGEVLLAGSAYPLDANGEPTKMDTMDVTLRMGAVNKTLRVYGKRTWRRGLIPLQSISSPEPFASLPLHYGNSYGCAEYGMNPLGKGHLSRRQRWLGKAVSTELPNIEASGCHPYKPRWHQQPAGFGPIDISWSQRSCKAGTYDDNWRIAHFPGYAPDIDWTVFNAAPEDQQQTDYWAGDEAFQILGMHPTHREIYSHLPGISARVFVREQGGAFAELKTCIDTVWFFPEHNLGALLFRTQRPVMDSEAQDISHLLLAYENMGDAPRALNYYRQALQLRTDKRTALAHVFNESQLSPIKSPEQLMQEARELEEELQRQKQLQQEYLAEIRTQNTHYPQDAPAIDAIDALPSMPVYTPQAIARGDIDLSELLATVEEQTRLVEEQAQIQLKDLSVRFTADSPRTQPDLASKKLWTRQQIRDQIQNAERQFLGQASINGQQINTQADTIPVDPSLQKQLRQYSPQPVVAKMTYHPLVHRHLRAMIQRYRNQGLSLAGRDMAGFNLSGLDLSDLDLRGALFEHANLSGCRLSGSRLDHAVLTSAILDDADFSHCHLSEANFCNAMGTGACFANSDFTSAMLIEGRFAHSDFSQCRFKSVTAHKMTAIGCDFRGAQIEKSNLVQANLTSSSWQRATLSQSLFIEAVLAFASFSQAQISRCALIKVNANLADFTGARLDRLQTGGAAQLIGARFGGVIANQCGFRDINLKGADLSASQMVECDFGSSNLSYTNWMQTNLFRSILAGSDISYSSFSEASLAEVKARNTKAIDTDFYCADFLQSDWQYSLWQACDYTGARNLNPVCLEIRQ